MDIATKQVPTSIKFMKTMTLLTCQQIGTDATVMTLLILLCKPKNRLSILFAKFIEHNCPCSEQFCDCCFASALPMLFYALGKIYYTMLLQEHYIILKLVSYMVDKTWGSALGRA